MLSGSAEKKLIEGTIAKDHHVRFVFKVTPQLTSRQMIGKKSYISLQGA